MTRKSLLLEGGCVRAGTWSAIVTGRNPKAEATIWPRMCEKTSPCLDPVPGLNLGKHPTERRKWERLPLAIPVFVRSKDGNDRDLLEFATALNVSAGGALVVVRRALPLSAQVLLEIPSAPLVSTTTLPRSSRNLQAKTVWTTYKDGYQLSGVKFSHTLLNSGAKRVQRRGKLVSSL
jgi:PilZ domain